MIFPNYISGSEASRMAEEDNLKEKWMGAKSWFEGVIESPEEFELEKMPTYNRFVCHMDYIESDLYYDFGGDYYFAVLNKLKTENMKRTIRLTESDLHNIIKESVNTILSELDWKTGMNAARKAEEAGDYKRARKFEKYAKEQFGWKHNNLTHRKTANNPEHSSYYQQPLNPKNPGGNRTLNSRLSSDVNTKNGNIEDYRIAHGGWKSSEGNETHTFDNNGYKKNFIGNKHSDLNNVSDEYNQKLNAMGNDMQNYYGGTAQYTPGKGWNS